jgi:hypothetical protein
MRHALHQKAHRPCRLGGVLHPRGGFRCFRWRTSSDEVQSLAMIDVCPRAKLMLLSPLCAPSQGLTITRCLELHLHILSVSTLSFLARRN